jgi:hypothetical protein
MPKLKRNPIADNGAPMGVSMCACGHAYVDHIKNMPSPQTERQCLNASCSCAQFVLATDEQARKMYAPNESKMRQAYRRLDASHMFDASWDALCEAAGVSS